MSPLRKALAPPLPLPMENEISAPQDGTIASVNVRKGDVVNSGDLLITMN